MGYISFAFAPKNVTKSEDIGPGQVNLEHLSPALYTEIRKIQLHRHSGQGSMQINLYDLAGYFTNAGFLMRSDDGTLWKITVSDAGALVVTEIT